MTSGAQSSGTAAPASAETPRLLAFDTATELCSAALLLGTRVLEANEAAGRGAGERILAMIDGLLRAAELPLRDLDAIAFGRGPGAFTGVRLAAGIAQGLAFGSGRPIVAVSDLLALAELGFELEPRAARILVCSDARMREVYWAVFGRDAGGGAVALGAERVGPPASVELAELAAAAGTTVGIGSGFAAYPALAAQLGPRLAAIHGTLLPRARQIVQIAAREWRAGRVLPASQALPVYLRDDVAVPRA